MADVPASLESIGRVARVLDEAGLPHVFIGGVALNTWGIPRATFDLDIVVTIDDASFPDLFTRFRKAGFVIDATFEKGFRDQVAGMQKLHMHLPVANSLMALDLFLASTPFLRSVVERRVSVDLGAGQFHVCTAADLILFKLLADRPKDRVDTSNVVAIQGIPERAYLERWARELGVQSRLADLLNREA